MKLKTSLFAAAAVVAMAPAAHAYEGLYGKISAGLSVAEDDLDFESTSGPVLFDQDIDYDQGVAVSAAFGKAYASGWRGEFEFTHRSHDARHIPGDNLGFSGLPTQLDGDVDVQTFMVNLIKDFDNETILTPFVGAGVGAARVNGELAGTNNTAAGGPLALAIDDTYIGLAAQALAGVGVELAEGLSLDLEYRYLWTDEHSFDGTVTANGVSNALGEFQTNFGGHSLMAGLRWNFGAPAPVAPPVEYKDCWDGSSVPVTAACPEAPADDTDVALEPIDFVVYFDYDKSNLTPEASNLIREAAARALEGDIDTVVVSGNTDSSGGAAYNQRLSERRASVVRDALIANGVSGDAIRVEANGENNPAKPTPDGVREPLNRRTEVTISFE